MIRSLALIICVFVLFSCNKESKELTTVEYKIVNDFTGVGFANVKVELYEEEYKTNIKTTKIWEGFTDVNGKVSHSFHARKKHTYGYGFTADIQGLVDSIGYEVEKFSEPFAGSIKKDQKSELNWSLRPFATRKFGIRNTSCLNDQDSMVYSRELEGIGEKTESGPWLGCYDYIEEDFKKVYATIYKFDVRVYRNGSLDSIFTIQHKVNPGVKEEFVLTY